MSPLCLGMGGAWAGAWGQQEGDLLDWHSSAPALHRSSLVSV